VPRHFVTLEADLAFGIETDDAAEIPNEDTVAFGCGGGGQQEEQDAGNQAHTVRILSADGQVVGEQPSGGRLGTTSRK
jgi:hypothetical protein